MRTFLFALKRLALSIMTFGVLIQVFFFLKIASLNWINPESTSFERQEFVRLALEPKRLAWGQVWVDDAQISIHLKRAVITSEDDLFATHNGVQWAQVQKAWKKDQMAWSTSAKAKTTSARTPKIAGASTITQQLAKNLFLNGERNLARKAQELIITLELEALLSKTRILEIYLNHVEWGQGIFGAEAAAHHYFGVSAKMLSPLQAARLAVMLPRPKYFERLPASGYLASRSEEIALRMMGAKLP
jgi:monofunctional biosynthetic peptidoglycan transglycosylase